MTPIDHREPWGRTENFSFSGLVLEPLNVGVGSAREEERSHRSRVDECTRHRALGRPLFWIARGEKESGGAQPRYPFAPTRESRASAAAGCGVATGIAGEPSQPNRAGRLQVKVILGQIDARATFGDERPGMAQLADGGVKLMAISARSARHKGCRLRRELPEIRETPSEDLPEKGIRSSMAQ